MAILIFMFHSHIHTLHCSYGILDAFVGMGAVAMTGFFLLSGYVVNLSYQHKEMTNAKEIKTFYLKRLITIIPLYFAWALIIIAANIIIGGKVALMKEIALFPIETLCIQSVYSSLFPFSHNGGSWFISCILICYLVYPLMQIVTKELSNKSKTLIIFLLCAILLYSPFVVHLFKLQSIYSNPFFRALEFSIGVLLSQLNTNERANNNKLLIFFRNPIVCILSIICLVSGITIAKHLGVPGDYMVYSWVALPCFMSLLISLGCYKMKRLQNSKTIKYLADISFCIFLSQIVYVWIGVKRTLSFVDCDSNIIYIIMSAAICFCIANILHYCVEVPSSKWLKQRLLN